MGRHARPRRRFVWIVIGVIAILLVADAAWAVWSANGALRSTRDDLRCGSEALLDGAIDVAQECFDRAQRHAATAGTFQMHPSMVLASFLPWIGDDVDAVSSMAEAARAAATGGASLTVAARAAGWANEVVLMGPEGEVDLDAIDRALPGLNAAADDLQQASNVLAAIDAGSLVDPLSTAVTEARIALQPQTTLVTNARDLGEVLPGMLGADGSKRYLLAFQNLSAPRGTGGYLGFLGELRAVDGTLSLDSLDPVGDVDPVPPVEVPPDVARRYGPFGVATTMWAANYPPDVEESSRIATQIWEASGRRPIDGVLWADTVWMADMLAATGPVDSSAWPEPITSENLVEVFNRRLFEGPDSTDTNAAQSQLGSDLWSALLNRQPDPTALGEAMAEGTREGHFAMFTVEDQTQATLELLDVAGRFDLGENPLAVVWQDASANRAGYFAEHEVASSVTLDPDGTATVQTTVTMRNGAPDHPPSILLGDGKGTPVGWWGVDVEIYMPTGAEDPKLRTSSPSVTDVDEAYGHPVADAFLFADAGGTSSATVAYDVSAAASERDGIWTYSLQVRPQPMLRPVPYALDLALPAGAEVVELPLGATADAGSIHWTGEPTSPLELRFVYRLAA